MTTTTSQRRTDRMALQAELAEATTENELWRRREATRVMKARARAADQAERHRIAALTESERVTEEAQTILDRLPIDRDAAEHRHQIHVALGTYRAPTATVADDGVVDEVAVQRAIRGDRVTLTPTERAEAIRTLLVAGESHATIADRLHIAERTVDRHAVRAS